MANTLITREELFERLEKAWTDACAKLGVDPNGPLVFCDSEEDLERASLEDMRVPDNV